jgi:hypothetical protein
MNRGCLYLMGISLAIGIIIGMASPYIYDRGITAAMIQIMKPQPTISACTQFETTCDANHPETCEWHPDLGECKWAENNSKYCDDGNYEKCNVDSPAILGCCKSKGMI